MKKVFTLLFFVAVLSSLTFGQYKPWTTGESWPANLKYAGSSGVHGLAVDPYSNVWIQPYGATDSIFNGTVWKAVKVLYIYKPDGTQASFSPIKTITVNGVTDTLWNAGRGIRADKDGNILVASFDAVYRINYKTGAGMGKITPTAGSSLTAPAVDGNGNVFTAHVSPGTGRPLKMWDASLNALGNGLDSTTGFARSFEVSADGNTIYWAGYTNHCILVYHRADDFSPFVLADTMFKGFDSESFTWNKAKGKKLYLSAGSLADAPNRYPGATTAYFPCTWYGYDFVTSKIVDSLHWNFLPTDSANQKARALGFTPSGDTAYISTFGSSAFHPVQRVTRAAGTDVNESGLTVKEYSLEQNYPNPFNPSTVISFNLAKEGYTTLKVYDILGNEVATLVNGQMTASNHTVSFDASKLASGTYIYRLVSGEVSFSKKMLLVK